ncbi:peritrophin-55 [Drosophila nasuta]|uniref:peritrophin-55 n=1 Tax=Drosophila nasuta TaxID=42062 RepID=UPI00295F199C|nr:peritrophin-55 [Drosophila nasuta]
MKAVILSSVAVLLLATVSVQAQSCASPEYTQVVDIDCSKLGTRIAVPNYNDIQSYYTCSSNKATTLPTLNNCSSTQYFTYVYQQCDPCADYIPAVPCSSLKVPVNCTNIAAVTTAAPTTAAPTTAAPTTAAPTTAAPTTAAPTTAAPTTKAPTTVTVPTPPVEEETTASSGDTTIYVPEPPSPNEGPTPPGPDPTAPNVPSGPPVVG